MCQGSVGCKSILRWLSYNVLYLEFMFVLENIKVVISQASVAFVVIS